jgi:4-amino-4-deoxy-L-arabinose transferase-like glycosyltransferase
MAKNITQASYRPNAFSQGGVFGYHPVLDSYYQALIMRFLGVNVFGWKISAVIITSLSIFIFYYFLKESLDELIAIFGALLLASSHYILGLTHTGYNNIHSLFPFLLALFLATKAKNKNSPFLAFLSGMVSGLGFYTFYAGRFAFIVVFFYFLLFAKPKLKILVAFLVGLVLSILPFLFVNRQNIFEPMTWQTFARNKEIDRIGFFLKNLKLNFLGIYRGASHIHHYVSGSLVDPITNLLSILGLISLILKKKLKLLFFLLGSSLFILIIAGGLFYENNVAITRLFIILPFIFTLAALGVSFLFEKISRSWQLKAFLVFCFTSLIVFLNLYRFYSQTPAVHPKTEAVKIMEGLLWENDLSGEEKESLWKKAQNYPEVLEAYKEELK